MHVSDPRKYPVQMAQVRDQGASGTGFIACKLAVERQERITLHRAVATGVINTGPIWGVRERKLRSRSTGALQELMLSYIKASSEDYPICGRFVGYLKVAAILRKV